MRAKSQGRGLASSCIVVSEPSFCKTFVPWSRQRAQKSAASRTGLSHAPRPLPAKSLFSVLNRYKGGDGGVFFPEECGIGNAELGIGNAEFGIGNAGGCQKDGSQKPETNKVKSSTCPQVKRSNCQTFQKPNCQTIKKLKLCQ